MIEMLWVLWYMVIFSGYIFGLLSLVTVIYLVIIKKPRHPKNFMISSFLIVAGIVAVCINYQYLRSGDPKYRQQLQQARERKENLVAAKEITFPTYKTRLNVEQTAEIANRHMPIHVIYIVKEQPHALTMYQYKKGTRPNTLIWLKNGSCDNEPSCQIIGDSSFGKVYVVNQRSLYSEAMYFASDDQTSLFIKYDNKISDRDVINFLDSLDEVKPQDLPFNGL